MARKCSLPARVPAPGTDVLPDDTSPKEETHDGIEELALRAFFHDYCVPSTNCTISRGFLNDLEAMVVRCGPWSECAKACKAVAFASHGIKLHRPSLLRKAETLYDELVSSLARVMGGVDISLLSSEMLTVVMLLGLYEIIVADEAHRGYHHVHAGGMAAMLRIGSSPLGLLKAVKLGHPLLTSGMICDQRSFFAPHVDNELDNILLEMGDIWDKMNPLPADDSEALRFLQQEALRLNHRLSQWQDRLPAGFMPTTVGQIPPSPTPTSPEPGHWPGAIDVYFDQYVAGVWNISRVARCVLIEIIMKIGDILQNNKDYTRERTGADHLCKELLSSIPYHLTECLPDFLRDTQSASRIQTPGRAVGGLLLMYPIFLLRQLSIVPLEMQEYLAKCLEWIGINMGVGQASILAKVRKLVFFPGCMIIWTGFLL
ncbi:putative C6 transcription factor [Aspergillus sclerotioniger CBS 115572]|uniref:Putative C6 transcription factor n=1 Tax=Aspergillus sclerotioniger CBS 115572 TaxID=1450535 RepID=A0A317W8K2_9EURO|nr:putative C6 transcription factor [Aspergillus sclerotioniger CBS 115572]PWY81627.1 putative C6 transcription factor [Aspergillus sclerotioniger CBS 115572]